MLPKSFNRRVQLSPLGAISAVIIIFVLGQITQLKAIRLCGRGAETGQHHGFLQKLNGEGVFQVTQSLIPPKIWQIRLPLHPGNADTLPPTQYLQYTPSWLGMNMDYNYNLMGQDGSEQFLQYHYAAEPRLIEMFRDLPNVGMKSDLLRYLLLSVEGGVYSDLDTIALKPMSSWINPQIRDKVRLVVGIEYDQRGDAVRWPEIPHWVQFCQWTIAAAPGHPVFRRMVDRIFQSVQELSASHGVGVAELKPTNFEVLNSTGPAAWTDVVLEYLQQHDISLKTTRDLSYMQQPVLWGDVLVLPVDGFGMGQSHSLSTNDGTIPESALVMHTFTGSWR